MNIKLLDKHLVISNIIIWTVHEIPYLVLFEHIQSPTTNQVIGTSTNFVFAHYRSYVIILGFSGILLIPIAALFGLMVQRNVQRLVYQAVPLVRRELDKQ